MINFKVFINKKELTLKDKKIFSFKLLLEMMINLRFLKKGLTL